VVEYYLRWDGCVQKKFDIEFLGMCMQFLLWRIRIFTKIICPYDGSYEGDAVRRNLHAVALVPDGFEQPGILGKANEKEQLPTVT
jgi:hypothetical protein